MNGTRSIGIGLFLRWLPVRIGIMATMLVRTLESTLQFIASSQPTKDFRQSVSVSIRDRRPFRTAKGHIGLAPARAIPGNFIALLRGGRVDLLLRSREGTWELIGDCYVHGIMYVEAWNEGKCEDLMLV